MTFKALLTADECLNIIEDFDSSTQTSVETEVFYNNSIGLWQPVTSLKHVEKFQRMLEPTYGPLKFENTYMRSYVKESTLKIHTDRPGLDITLSVCLEHDFEGEWPLYASKEKWIYPEWKTSLYNYNKWDSNFDSFELGLGDGCAMNGRLYPHWRDTFTQTGRGVYIFYHWSIVQ